MFDYYKFDGLFIGMNIKELIDRESFLADDFIDEANFEVLDDFRDVKAKIPISEFIKH